MNEHILIITKTDNPGNGFGDHNNSDGIFDVNCTECRVRFVDSDNPFGYVYARGVDIISWTDEEIRLNIPSATGTVGFYQHSAASGKMRVESPIGNSNEVEINIPYSVLNFQASGTISNPAKRFASELQTPGGIIFNYHQNVVGGKKEEVNRAINRWCDATSVGWNVSDEILQDNDIAGLLNGNDNRNIISVQPDSEFPSAVARAFVKITGHFNACNSSQVFYIHDVDVAINDESFQNNEADNWYNYVLHELGHAHLLYHSINPDGGTDNEYIMFYDLTSINNVGQSAGNQHWHPIHPNDEEGAETIFSSSANLLAPCTDVTPITAIGCTGVNSIKEPSKVIADILVYPNPNFGHELFLSLSLEEKLNFTINLFTVTNLHLVTFKPIESVVGENLISLPLPSNLPQGSYIISVSSEKGIFFLKFVQI